MVCGIYIITNKITGKSYIGQSVDINRRITEHKYVKSDSSYIDRSINKYGWENFTWDILYECHKEYLDEEEQKFIKLYGTYTNGYNLTWGGDFNPSHIPEIREKISESLKGRKVPYEISAMVGKKVSETKNTVGYYRVSKKYDKTYKLGYIYTYSFPLEGKQKQISDFSLIKLENKVREKGLEWFIIDSNKAYSSLNENLKDLNNINKSHINNITGFYRVSKVKNKRFKQGYEYTYSYPVGNGKIKSLRSTSIFKLEHNVKVNGLKWKIVDEELARKTIKSNIIDLNNAKKIPHKNTGRKLSEKELYELNKINNKSGYFHVSKYKHEKSSMGYYLSYVYYENGKRKKLNSNNIIKLEEKVKDKGLPWLILDYKKANRTFNQNMLDLILFKKKFAGVTV